MRAPGTSANPLRVVAKALLLFALFNAGFAYVSPEISRFSVFGRLVPPMSTFPVYVRDYETQAAHQIGVQNVFDVGVLFAAHRISKEPKGATEYRVVAIGDSTTLQSSIWQQINAQNLKTCRGKSVRVFNLGYNGGFAAKDLLILQQAMKYQPDLVIWSFAQVGFLEPIGSFAEANPARLDALAAYYGVSPNAPRYSKLSSLLSGTVIGRRQQLYIQTLLDIDAGLLAQALGDNNVGVMAMAVQDHAALEPAEPIRQQTAARSQYWLGALAAAHQIAAPISVMLVSEPVNLGSTRFDTQQYAEFNRWIAELSAQNHWTYLALWNLLPPQEFIDTIHRTPAGDSAVEKKLKAAILSKACGGH